MPPPRAVSATIGLSRRFRIIPLALAVVLLLGAVGVGAAFADDPPSTSTNYHDVFLSKLASILGIDEQKLTDAFTQARTEMIDQPVQDGRITQERADWMKQNLKDGSWGSGAMGMKRGGKMGGRMGGQFGPWVSAPAPTE